MLVDKAPTITDEVGLKPDILAATATTEKPVFDEKKLKEVGTRAPTHRQIMELQ